MGQHFFVPYFIHNHLPGDKVCVVVNAGLSALQLISYSLEHITRPIRSQRENYQESGFYCQNELSVHF
jgi:hypothetical protein